jgi:hypothetical protein
MQRVWSATLDALATSREVEKSGVLQAFGSTLTSAEDLRTRLDTLRNRPARLFRELGWAGTLGFAALVLVLPVAVAWLTKSVLQTNQAAQVISIATAALSTLGIWLRAAAGAVAKVDKAAERVAAEYAKQVDNDPMVTEAHGALAAAQARLSAATTELRVAREELARARADAASATLPAQMLQLVTNRLDAQSYSRELTTTSLARADLEAMSTLLREQMSEPPATPMHTDVAQAVAETVAKAALKRVERVILYIDDLDRCKPQDVVRVLQLVHMLLAFELFAVVVAVDARWVEESLRQSYRWLSPDDSNARTDGDDPAEATSGNGVNAERAIATRITPQDYLEKIFQIAFWLTPMTAQQAAQYLKSLVRAQSRQSGPVLGARPGPRASIPGDISTSAPIEIEAIELDYMRYLAAYVGSSPRRVKRLVNAYRLIKANLSDPQLETFLTRVSKDGGGRALSGPYQLVIGLLAIGTGAPASAATIFGEIEASDSRVSPDEIVRRFREVNHSDWSMAAQVIEVVLRSQRAKDIRELRDWTSNVGRFLLNSPLDQMANRMNSTQLVPH